MDTNGGKKNIIELELLHGVQETLSNWCAPEASEPLPLCTTPLKENLSIQSADSPIRTPSLFRVTPERSPAFSDRLTAKPVYPHQTPWGSILRGEERYVMNYLTSFTPEHNLTPKKWGFYDESDISMLTIENQESSGGAIENGLYVHHNNPLSNVANGFKEIPHGLDTDTTIVPGGLYCNTEKPRVAIDIPLASYSYDTASTSICPPLTKSSTVTTAVNTPVEAILPDSYLPLPSPGDQDMPRVGFTKHDTTIRALSVVIHWEEERNERLWKCIGEQEKYRIEEFDEQDNAFISYKICV